MNMVKTCMALALALTMAGCTQPMVSRAVEPNATITGIVAADAQGEKVMVATAYDVARVEVTVPRSLLVTEANTFVPMADLVWHGDPLGDRHEQVRDIMDEAARRGTSAMTQGEEVVVQIEVLRFHALTPKARYTVGGNFATRFVLTVRDAQSGALIDGPRLVVADTRASGGQRAMEEEAAGITQRVVIVNHVSQVIARELGQRLAPKDQVLPQAMSRNAFEPSDLGIAQ